MSFFGKEYSFERQENFENFVNSLGITPEEAQGILNYRPSVKFLQDGDSYTMITSTPQTKKELTFKSGVPFEEKVANRTCQTTYTVNGNIVIQTQKFEDGAEFNFTREFNDDQLVLTITSTKYSGTARRYYKA